MGYLIRFFLRDGIHSRRTIWMTILSLIPIASTVVVWLVRPLLEGEGVMISSLYNQMSFLLFLHFLLPLMALFIGTAVISDEVEERTLPYLMVRPVPRWEMVLSKMLAGCITIYALLFFSSILTYSALTLSGGFHGWVRDLGRLFRSLGVLLLGLLVYVPFFTVLGGVLKRPVLAGLLFVFGWESAVAFFPGNVKLLTVAHYLHVLIPKLQRVRGGSVHIQLLDNLVPQKEISPVVAVLVLLGLAALFGGLALSLLHIREYRLEQN